MSFDKTDENRPKFGNKTARYYKSGISDLQRERFFNSAPAGLGVDLKLKFSVENNQYDRSLPMKREGEGGVLEIRLSPALMDWCTEVGQANLKKQKSIIKGDPEKNIRSYVNEWIIIEDFRKFMRAGFAKSEWKHMEAAMRWWESTKRTDARNFNAATGQNKTLPTFLDTLNCERVPRGLVSAFRNWR